MIKDFGQLLLNVTLLVLIVLSCWSLGYASTANPGHPWSQIGDGNFAATGATAPRVYTVPNANTNVLTDASTVTVEQGGTGASSLTGVLVSAGLYSPLTATTAPNGVLVDNSSSQTLTNKSIDVNALYGYALEDYEGYTGYYGGLLKSNGTRFVRMNLGSPLQLLRTNATSSNLEWVNNPVGPAGSNKEVQYNNGGSLGATSSLTWDNSTRDLKLLGILNMSSTTVPSVAPTGTLRLVNASIAGREFLTVATSWGGDKYALQPSLFQNYFTMIATGGSASMTNLGTNIANTGTISHPGGPEATGIMTNVVSSAAGNSVGGVNNSALTFYRGSTAGINGFFMFARIYLPDSSYDQSGASTGSRVYVGFASGGVANWAISDNASGHGVGFSRYHTNSGRQDANWTVLSKDNSTMALATTSMPFYASNLYDFYLYTPPQGSSISWRIDNVTSSTSEQGVITSNLPGSSSAMSVGAYVGTVNAVARNIRIQKIYVEVPR
jgi:hypothetical protein